VTILRLRPPDCASRFGFRFRDLLAALLLTALCLFGTSSASPSAPEPNGEKPKPYALIFGTVWGPDDYPAYGVKVKIRRADQKKPRWELYSDHHGEFAQRLPAGKADYVVWADLKGYKSADGKPLQLVSEVTVHIEKDERADIGLHLK
jgi:hypothetical protein